MSYTQLKNFFAENNLNVSFNALGETTLLKNLFVKETMHLLDGNQSHFEKYKLYSHYYDFEQRPKLTGFEQVAAADQFYRSTLEGAELMPQFNEATVTGYEELAETGGNYLDELKKYLASLENPVIYLSGGIDSEFVARAAIDAGISFTPVIYEWIEDGNIINLDESIYAVNFCDRFNLKPVMKSVDISELWASDAFKDLSRKTGLISPQLTTYVHIIQEIDCLLGKVHHVFGGEVRYQKEYTGTDSLATLIFSAKTTPGYNGFVYTRSWVSPSGTSNVGRGLVYSNSGSWAISTLGNGSNGDGGPTTGTWTTTPGASYEYRVVSITDLDPGGTANVATVPASAPSSWQPISGGTVIAEVSTQPDNVTASGTFSFAIEVRAVLTPATVMSSSITLITSREF